MHVWYNQNFAVNHVKVVCQIACLVSNYIIGMFKMHICLIFYPRQTGKQAWDNCKLGVDIFYQINFFVPLIFLLIRLSSDLPILKKAQQPNAFSLIFPTTLVFGSPFLQP